MINNTKWLSGLTVGLTCAFISLSGGLHANYASIKAHGMGQTAVANPQDSLTPVYNPATAVRICDRWDLGLHIKYWNKDLNINDSANTNDNRKFRAARGPVYLPEFGFNRWYNNCWAVGVTLHTHEFLKTHHKTRIEGLGGTAGKNARLDFHVERLSFHVAHRFNRCHNFGASLDFYAGRFKADGLDNITDTTNAGRVFGKGYDYTQGFGFTLGWLGNIYPCLDLGVSYSHEIHMRQLDRYKGLLAQGKINIPSIFRAGAAYRLGCAWVFAFDYEYRFYNKVRSLSNEFPGTADAGDREGLGFAWKNQWILKFGVAYELNNCWTLRLGYRHEKAPMRTNSADTYLNALAINTVEDIITTGFTYKWDRCTEVNFYFDYGFPHKITGSIPTATFGGGTASYREKYFVAGIGIGRYF